MIRREGERLYLAGPATLVQVATILQQGLEQLREGVSVIDLGEVTELDSSLLAALLAWLREARKLDRPLAFSRLPQGLTTIAGLYGVADLLPPPAAPAHH